MMFVRLSVVALIISNLVCPASLRAEAESVMTSIDFALIPCGTIEQGDLYRRLQHWKSRRVDGSADPAAFEALVYFTGILDGTGAHEDNPVLILPQLRFGHFVCQQTLLDAFYIFPTTELEKIVAAALSSSEQIRRKTGLLAAAAVSDVDGIRRRLIEIANSDCDSSECGDAVLAMIALGEGRTQETLAACRDVVSSSHPVIDASSVAVRRLAATLGQSPVPEIDLDMGFGSGPLLPSPKQAGSKDMVLLWSAEEFSGETAKAFSGMLKKGGTVLIMNPSARPWPVELQNWAKEVAVTLPSDPERSKGPGLIYYPDYRAFCDFPYHIAEEQGTAADYVWQSWDKTQDAPVRSIIGTGAMVVVHDRVIGNGRIVFTTVNLNTKGVYRQNVLRWLYGEALLVRPDINSVPLYEMDTEITTPHHNWASDWAPGIPRVMWVSTGKRGLIETRQRVAMDSSYTPFDLFKASATAWTGEGLYKTARTDQGLPGQDSIVLMGQRAVALIEAGLANMNVLVMDADSVNMLRGSMTHSHIAEIDFNAMPARLRRQILRRIDEGMGLVILGNTSMADQDAVSGAALHEFIGPMHPFDSDERIESSITARTVGRGRLVWCDEKLGIRHLNILHRYIRELPVALQAPGVLRNLSLIDTEEYTYAMLGKIILWASGKDAVPVITELAMRNDDKGTVSLHLALTTPFDGFIEGVLRNRYNEETHFGPLIVEGSQAVLPLPYSLSENQYVIEAVLKNTQGETVNFAAAQAEVALPVLITEVDTGTAFHREGETIKLSAKLSVPFTGAAAVKVRDNYGRLVYATQQRSVSEATVLEFDIPVQYPLTRRWEAEILLLRGNSVVVRMLRPLGIALPPPPLDFHTETSLPPSPLEGVFRDKLAANLIYGNSHTADIGMRYNFDFTGSSWGLSLGDPGDWVESTQPNVLAFSPSDPALRYNVIKTVRKHAPLMADLGINSYMIADELFSSGRFGPISLCPYSRERFNLWLRTEYEQLDDLNREWGADYGFWNDVQPMTGDDSQHPGSHVDYRRFQIWEFAESARIFEIAGGDYMPDFVAGYSASGSWNTLLEFSGWVAYYGVDEHVPAVMRRKKNRVIGAWYHPGYMFCENHEATCRRWPWWHLFRGTTRMNLWFTAGSPAVHDDLRIYKSYLWLGEEMRELRGNGLGKLLLHARRDEGRAAVYTSERNGVVHRTLKTLNGPDWACVRSLAPYFVSRLIECRDISEYQVERGEITERELKLLMLPSVPSLSARERGELREFVCSGGVLVADFAPGTRNEHGTWMGDAFARELFGVEVVEGTRRIEASPIRFDVSSESASFAALRSLPEWTVDCVGSNTVLVDGKAAAQTADGAPVLIVKKVGDGMSVLLNFPFPGGQETGKVAGALVKDLAVLSGVAPMAELDAGDNKLPRVDFGLFRDGDVFYAGLVAEGGGGMIEKETVVDTRVTFPVVSHLYDTRDGIYLGETTSVDWHLTPGIAKLYAGLPTRMRELRTVSAHEAYHPGDLLEIRVFGVADTNITWRQIFRVRAMRPDGSDEPAYSQTIIAENGSTVLRLPIALDAAVGKWTFEFRDAATGMEGICSVTIGK